MSNIIFPKGTKGWDRSMVMLAKRFDKVKIKPEGWLISEKLDGIRGVWDGEKMWSRQGKEIYTPEYFTENFPPFPLDGELWVGRGLFQQTMSVVRQQFPDDRWKTVKYLVFDGMYDLTSPFKERHDVVKTWFEVNQTSFVKVVDQIPCTGQTQLKLILDNVIQVNGEGLMIRDPEAPYEGKRTKSILKIKPIYDAEAKILGYTDGKGKYEGMVGALKVIDEEGHEFKLSGMNDELRANPPPIGSIVTFQYNDKTTYGVPRFARFINVREDYEWHGKEAIIKEKPKPKKRDKTKGTRVEDEITFCFTGPMYDMSRAQIKSYTIQQGFAVRGSVTKKLNYLVTNTPQSKTGKNKKAIELGTTIINEKEFMVLIGELSES